MDGLGAYDQQKRARRARFPGNHQPLISATVEDGKASYQYKGPLGFLEMSPGEAFCDNWWAIAEAFVTK